MDYSLPLGAIRRAIAHGLQLQDRTVAGKVVHSVEWAHRNTAARWVKGVCADLQVTSIVSVGRDEKRQGLTDDDRLQVYVCGNRVVCVEVVVRSDSQEPWASAQVMADTLRTALRWPSLKEILRDSNVGLSHIGVSVAHDWVDATERFLSEAVMEVYFNLAVTSLDLTNVDTDGDYVETVEAQGTLETGFDGVDRIVDIEVP